MSELIVVTGPARSGKSERAEQWAAGCGRSVVYLATAQREAGDAEWQERLAAHRRRRPPTWETIEVPEALPTAIAQSPADACLLVDSLGTWVANLLDLPEPDWAAAVETLLTSLEPGLVGGESRPVANRLVILVAEETGWGVVPAYASGRLFRDRLGTLVRRVAARADRVELVVAGWAVDLRAIGQLV